MGASSESLSGRLADRQRLRCRLPACTVPSPLARVLAQIRNSSFPSEPPFQSDSGKLFPARLPAFSCTSDTSLATCFASERVFLGLASDYHPMNPRNDPAGLMFDTIRKLSRLLLPCLLAFVLAGLGPTAFAALPQALNAGSEEERPAAEHAVGGQCASSARASRPLRFPTRRTRTGQCRLRAGVSRARGASPARPVSLRTLETRIQV
jgi:hypothetical protein